MGRNQNIECLRVWMMLSIVIMHLSGGSVSSIPELLSKGGINSAIFFSYRSLTHLGVPTFAFISGFYGISFKIKKFIDLEIMAVTYGVVVLILTFMLGEPTWGRLSENIM